MSEASPNTGPASGKASTRLVSLDALRGFDMFWIIGADALGGAFKAQGEGGFPEFMATQLEHSRWVGLTFYDLIFPLFIFMMGVAIPYSLGRIAETGGKPAALQRIVRRAVIMYALGLVFYGGFITPPNDEARLMGVLQRLAICYLFASVLFLTFKPRGLVVVCVSLLVGYWAMMTYVPVPGFGAGNFDERSNLAWWVDSQYLWGRKWYVDYDPEGLLSNIPAVASCLLGVFAGLWMRDKSRDGVLKAAYLAAAGVALVLSGELWALQFPIIKKIWTSSYVLVTGGYSALLLAVFYLVIDVWNFRKWATPFVWIGCNALTIYLISHFVDFGNLSRRLAGGWVEDQLELYDPGTAVLVQAFVGIGLCVWICQFLYERKVFLRL